MIDRLRIEAKSGSKTAMAELVRLGFRKSILPVMRDFEDMNAVYESFKEGDGSYGGARGEKPKDGYNQKLRALCDNSTLLLGSYQGGAYEGASLVIYEHGGVIYRDSCYHCSCYGLEGLMGVDELEEFDIAGTVLTLTNNREYGLDEDDNYRAELVKLIEFLTGDDLKHLMDK